MGGRSEGHGAPSSGRHPAKGKKVRVSVDARIQRTPDIRDSTEPRYALVWEINGIEAVFPLKQGVTTFGRSQTQADVTLDDETVSRVHVEIRVRNDRVELRDRDARNGTYVNGERARRRLLHLGDEIMLGKALLHLTDSTGEHARLQRRPVAKLEREHAAAPGDPDNVKRSDSTDSGPLFADHSEFGSLELTWSGPSGRQAREDELERSVERVVRRRFARSLADLGHFLVSDHDEEHVHENCLKAVARLFHFRAAQILVLNEVGEPETRCALPKAAATGQLQMSRTLIGQVIRDGKGVLIEDSLESRMSDTAKMKGIRSAIVAPLLENDKVIGVLYLDQDDPKRAFQERHLRRLLLLANLVAAKIVQAQVHNEMVWAGYIQRSLLREKPNPPTGYDLDFKLEPCVQVGGDFYETLELPDGRLLVALGDISGHGVGPALVMANTLATIRALAPHATTPLSFVERLTELIEDQVRAQGFLTLFLGFLDPKTHTMEYVSAGHEYPALFVPGQPVQDIISTGPAIGMRIPVPLEQESIVLPPGTLFCVWSDGIPEALRRCAGPAMDFSRERLVEELDEMRERPASEITRRVFGQLELFLDCARAQDDRTFVALRRSFDA